MSSLPALPSRRLILSGLAASTATSCGFLMYPERAGAPLPGQRMDPQIILLDGLLCLLFIVPGLVAFAVDIGSGCIYLPLPAEPTMSRFRRLPLRGRRRADLDAAIAALSGRPGGLGDPGLLVVDVIAPLSPEQLADVGWTEGLTRPARDLVVAVDDQGNMIGMSASKG